MARMGLVVAGAGIVASGLAAIALLRAPEIVTTTERTPETLPSAAPPPSAPPAAIDLETLLAACPLVDRATATRLRQNPAVAALGQDEFTLLVLSMGDQGLETLGSEKVAEVQKAFALMFAAMSSEERAAFGVIVAQLRAGRQPAPGEAATALSALRTASLRLPAGPGERLRGLYSAAIDSGIAHQRAAAERTRSAVVFPSAAPPVYRPGRAIDGWSRNKSNMAYQTPVARAERPYEPAPIARERRGDAYWRPLLAAAQERVKRAERELEMAERASANSDPPTVGAGVSVPATRYIGRHGTRTEVDMTGRGAVELLEESRKAERAAQGQATQSRGARDQAIARARRQLDQARAELARIEDEARADLVAIR